MPQTLFTNATLACLDGTHGYGLNKKSALLVDGEQIAWHGSMQQLPILENATVFDCEQRLVTPGLIDCHTHLVYSGDRADEFEMRLEGASYTEIAASGGGIVATVRATRAASDQQLFDETLPRLNALLREGVTTLEIKSGYGLDVETEIKMLRVADKLAQAHRLRVQKTLLSAHALAPEFTDRADDYIELVCDEILPRAHDLGLVDAVDVFIESIAFNRAQGERVLARAQQLGLPIKAHVEQLSNLGGAVMAARRGALSVDHLEFLSDADVPKLVQHDTVAVLLPGAYYFLGETQLPPLSALRAQQVPIALATDANPGSSPLHSLLLIMNMACTLFRMTPAESLRGVTINAAKALGLQRQIGSLEVGKQADIVVWDIDNPALLSYRVGVNPCRAVMQAGRFREAVG